MFVCESICMYHCCHYTRTLPAHPNEMKLNWYEDSQGHEGKNRSIPINAVNISLANLWNGSFQYYSIERKRFSEKGRNDRVSLWEANEHVSFWKAKNVSLSVRRTHKSLSGKRTHEFLSGKWTHESLSGKRTNASVCLSVCLSLWRSSGAVSTLCFVWKFSCITFHSLIHAYMYIYINNACNLISIHQ